MAAIRTGQIDHIGKSNTAALTAEEYNQLKKTTPDIQKKSWWLESWALGFLFDDPNHPWADLRVRQAMQMSINAQELSSEYYQGHVPPIIWPSLGESAAEFITPLSEMAKNTRDAYEYNPESGSLLKRATLTDSRLPRPPRGRTGLEHRTDCLVSSTLESRPRSSRWNGDFLKMA